MKDICKAISFIALVILMLYMILGITNYKDMGGGGGWQRFYDSPKNTMDVICFGNSHCHCTVDHSILWENYGIAGYSMTAAAQSIEGTYYFIKEAMKYQKPRVILIECDAAIGKEPVYDDAFVYRNTLGMRYSANYFEFVHYLLDKRNSSFEERLQLIAKLPIVHSRYKELSPADFDVERPYLKGYVGSDSVEAFQLPWDIYNTDVGELNPTRFYYLGQIIDYCNKENIDVVFFIAPTNVYYPEQTQYNALKQYFNEREVPFINCNDYWEEMGFDYSQDLRDAGHLNDFGAAKVTRFLGDYLVNNYNFDDHTGDSRYDEWDMNCRYLQARRDGYALYRNESITEYLSDANDLKDKYQITVSLRGEHRIIGDFYFNSLMKLGIPKEQLEQGGTWLISGDYVELIEEPLDMKIVEHGIVVKVYDSVSDYMLDQSACDLLYGDKLIREN